MHTETIATPANADVQTAPKMKMTTDIPGAITTPDKVETRLGTLKFFDGLPDKETAQKVYDNLDFQRGVAAVLNTMPVAGLYATREGFATMGPPNQTVCVVESLLDPKSLILTANSETIYTLVWLDTKNGPLVVELPPNVLGMVDDFWQRPVVDVGRTGPDKGKGGKYLFLPPGYKGKVPEGYFVVSSPTFGNFFFFRGFLVDGDIKPALDAIKKQTRVYSLAQAAQPPEMKFVNISGRAFNTIHASDFSFFEEVNQVVQEEPTEAIDADTLGLLASIGIQKGKPFAPDARMKKILSEAAAVGNATARALSFSPATHGITRIRTADGLTRSSAGSTSSTMGLATSMPARSTTSSPWVSRQRSLSRWSEPGRNTPRHSRTPRAAYLTAARPTRFTCRPTSRPRISGHLSSMTTRRAPCSRRTSDFRASAVKRRMSLSIPTRRWKFGSARLRRRVMRRIGFRPFRGKAGSSSCVSMARLSRGSIRRGSRARSNW